MADTPDDPAIAFSVTELIEMSLNTGGVGACERLLAAIKSTHPTDTPAKTEFYTVLERRLGETIAAKKA